MEERTIPATGLAGMLAVGRDRRCGLFGGRQRLPAASTGGARCAGASPGGASGAAGGFACEDIGGEVTVYATWTGAEQDSFDAMIAPWLECTGVDHELHRAARPGRRADDGHRRRQPARRRRPARPRPDAAVVRRRRRSSRSTSSTSRPTRRPRRPGFAALGKAPDGKLVGIFTKAAVKGLIWYNTGVWHGRRARRPGTSSRPPRPAPRPATPRRGASASSPVATPAGRAPTGSRTSSCARPAPRSTTAGSPARSRGPIRRSRPPSRSSATAVDERLRRLGLRQRDGLRQGREPDVHRPARLPVPPPGELHHRLLRDRGRRDGRPVRLLPVPGHRSGQLRA